MQPETFRKLPVSGALRVVTAISLLAFTPLPLLSQSVKAVSPDTSQRVDASASANQATSLSSATKHQTPERVPDYVLGVDDQLLIRAFKVDELSDKPIAIGGDGYVNLPLVGRVKAAGLTVVAFEADLTNEFGKYVRDPQVSVLVADYRSEPVSVVGDVNSPGVQQLKGRKTLVEVIALAGGLKADAGTTATITREIDKGKLPLRGATEDQDGRFSVAHVNLRDIMEGRDPQDNITIETNDVVMIPKARLLYVVGEVQKPGGYVLNEQDSISVLQAVALAGGLTTMAAPKKAKILHQDAGGSSRSEVPTNVSKILDGQERDVELHAEDILFIPNNLPKSAGSKALAAAINMAGVAIWKF